MPYKDTFVDMSIWGAPFEDENLKIRHKRKYLLSMANRGPNTNGSQFFITYDKLNALNRKHVIFGEIVDGKEVVKYMERYGTNQGDPQRNVLIVDSGCYPRD